MNGRPYDNTNAYRAYPFIEDEQLGDLGNDVVLDAKMLAYTSFGANTVPLTLESITVNAMGTAMTVQFAYGTASPTLVVSAASSDQYYETYETDVHGDLTYMLRMLFGAGTERFCTDHAGTTVTFQSPRIEPCCIVDYTDHRVMSVTGSFAGSERLTGKIKLMSGYGCNISLDTIANAVRISAGVGLGLGIPCEVLHPETDLPDCDKMIYSINGMTPDWMGEIKIQGREGIYVTAVPEENKVVIGTAVDHCRPKCKDPAES